MTQETIRRLSTALFSISIALTAGVFVVIPHATHAGITSFFANLFYQSAEATSPQRAPHTATALKAALNVDPNPSKGGGDITIVEGSALLPETGPAGSLADIEERPHHGGQISIYVVREGDSLSQIAKMFGVSVNTIVWANDITRSSLVREGQTLVILPISGIQHTVKKGDTLKSIAKEYKGDFNEILEFNGLSADSVLAVGDTITIPDGEMSVPASYNGNTSRVVAGSGGPTYSGYYIKPVGGKKSQGLHGYNGIDIAAPIGTPIVAAASGSVIISRDSGWNGGYGAYIVIRHENGTQTLYAHNSQNIVYSGDYVVQGQVIGYVGNTGRSTGPHLHFEVRGAANPF